MDKKEKDIEKQNLLRHYRECFSTPSGKAVLADLVRRCGIMENTFHIESDRADCYASGRKSIGFEILELMNYATIEGYYEFKKQQIAQLTKQSIVGKYFK